MGTTAQGTSLFLLSAILLAGCGGSGRREARAKALGVMKSCAVGGLPYGDPPSGMSYEKLGAADRKQLLAYAIPGTEEIDVDASVAVRGSKQVAFLIALPDPDSTAVRSIESEVSSAKSHPDSFGGRPVLVLRDPLSPSRMVLGKRGCISYAVIGSDQGTVEAVARGIFK